MALKSTVCKATLNVADVERNYYAEHPLTIAVHPSETPERMMVRVLAFAICAHPQLSFGRGISSDDEPALWQRDDTGAIQRWIEVGLPDERLLRRARGRADEVLVFAYGGRAVEVWWQQNKSAIEKLSGVKVLEVPLEASRALAAMAARNMALSASITGHHVYFSDANDSVELELTVLTPENG